MRADREPARGGERGADHRDLAVPLLQEPPAAHRQRAIVAIGRRHGEVDAEDELLVDRHELRGRGIQRQHDLGLHTRHARHLRDRTDRRGRQDPAGGEARPHAHAPAGDGDLAEHEAIATLDETHDALAHGAERDEPRDADGDTQDGEEIPAKDPQDLTTAVATPPPSRGGPDGFATGVRLDGTASSRSCEHRHRTSGETTSGSARRPNACSMRSAEQHGRGAVAGRGDESSARPRIVPPHHHAIDDVLDRRAPDRHRPHRERSGVPRRLLHVVAVAHAPTLPEEGPHQRGDEHAGLDRPANEDPSGDVAADRDPVGDRAEPTPLARAGRAATGTS